MAIEARYKTIDSCLEFSADSALELANLCLVLIVDERVNYFTYYPMYVIGPILNVFLKDKNSESALQWAGEIISHPIFKV